MMTKHRGSSTHSIVLPSSYTNYTLHSTYPNNTLSHASSSSSFTTINPGDAVRFTMKKLNSKGESASSASVLGKVPYPSPPALYLLERESEWVKVGWEGFEEQEREGGKEEDGKSVYYYQVFRDDWWNNVPLSIEVGCMCFLLYVRLNARMCVCMLFSLHCIFSDRDQTQYCLYEQ